MTLYTLYTPIHLNLILLYIFNKICYVCVGLLRLGWLEFIVVMDKPSIATHLGNGMRVT